MPYYLSKQNTPIYYKHQGHSGPVVILLHGLASSSQIWARQARILQKYCQVYSLDFPGHGKSGWQSQYSINNLAELLKQWMDDMDIQQAHIIALSLGCSVALTFAGRYPSYVKSLILEGPVGGYRPWWVCSGWLDQLVFRLLPVFLYFSIRLRGLSKTAYWINHFGVKTNYSLKTLQVVQHQADFKVVYQLLWNSACAPYRGLLHNINAPVLLIRGSDDPMPKRFVQYIQTHIGTVTYVEFPNTRHLVALERPVEFNCLVLGFLNLKRISLKNTSVLPVCNFSILTTLKKENNESHS